MHLLLQNGGNGVIVFFAPRRPHHMDQPGLWTVAITLPTAPLGWAVARWFSEPINRRLRVAS
jgi:hypothetical protein